MQRRRKAKIARRGGQERAFLIRFQLGSFLPWQGRGEEEKNKICIRNKKGNFRMGWGSYFAIFFAFKMPRTMKLVGTEPRLMEKRKEEKNSIVVQCDPELVRIL